MIIFGCSHVVVNISNDTSYIGLTHMAETAITWAIGKMQEDEQTAKLAETNKSVAIALENLNTAKQQLAVTIFLSKEHEPTC